MPALSISHCWEREGNKRKGIEKSIMLSQGVGTLLEKICCPAWSRQGLDEGVHQKVSTSEEFFEFSNIVRLRILNHMYQILE